MFKRWASMPVVHGRAKRRTRLRINNGSWLRCGERYGHAQHGHKQIGQSQRRHIAHDGGHC